MMSPDSHLASSLPISRDMTLLTQIKTLEPRLASEEKWKFHIFYKNKIEDQFSCEKMGHQIASVTEVTKLTEKFRKSSFDINQKRGICHNQEIDSGKFQSRLAIQFQQLVAKSLNGQTYFHIKHQAKLLCLPDMNPTKQT